jgi:hypothetical protein
VRYPQHLRQDLRFGDNAAPGKAVNGGRDDMMPGYPWQAGRLS